MDNVKKNHEESWTVEPPRKNAGKRRRALRIELIVAAIGVATAAGACLYMYYQNWLRTHFMPHVSPIFLQDGSAAQPKAEETAKACQN